MTKINNEDDSIILKKSYNPVLSKTLFRAKDSIIFNRLDLFKSPDEYLDYLIKLDIAVNGSSEEFEGHDIIPNYLAKLKSNKKDLNEEEDKLLEEIKISLEEISSILPPSAVMSGEDGVGYYVLGDDDNLSRALFCLDKIIAIRKEKNNG